MANAQQPLSSSGVEPAAEPLRIRLADDPRRLGARIKVIGLEGAAGDPEIRAIRLGRQLAQAGVAESRVTKLLTARGEAFRQLLPRGLRDAAYRWLASNRYRWFGRHEACALPAPEHRQRFL